MAFELIGQFLCGWLIADFLSGLFHWWQDVYGDARTPVIGPLIVLGAQEHHADPLDFLGAGVLKRNRGVWAVAGLASVIWFVVLGPSMMWLAATVAGLISGQIHELTHRPPGGSVLLRCLRATGLVQAPAQHLRHHRLPDTNYCAVTNWLNPPLDAIGFWRGLERAAGIFGFAPAGAAQSRPLT